SLRELAPSHPAVAALEAGRVGAAEETVAVDTGDDLLLVVEPPTAPSGGDELALVAAGAVSDEVVEEEPVAIDDEAVMLEDAPVPARAPAIPQAATAPAPAARAAPPLRLVPPPPPVATRPAPPRAAPQEGIEEELKELDFFLEQDLRDEAREALQRLLRTHPQDPRLLQRRAALERRSTPAPAPAPQVRRPSPPVPAPPAPAVESFDIARELAEELGPQPSGPLEDFQYSVEDVFDQFKKAVAQSVGAEDSDTHYDLGIAYKEMGLLDDALHEFEVALAGNGRKKEIDCLTMIGICRLEKGEPGAAVEAYQRALRSGGLTPEAARAIHYELAGALEASGDRASALQSIQKVLKAEPGYRDAKAIAARLAAAPVPPGPKKNIGYV
ncbi:MAG TPA: tetratricopeptide repeat protein, partial [Anaeromyxobacteraceae bacterium]